MSLSFLSASRLFACFSLCSPILADIPSIYPTPQEQRLEDIFIQATSLETLDASQSPMPIPQVEGAYGIVIEGDKVKVFAHDETGFFYAKQTLIQLLQDYPQASYAQHDPLADVTIDDVIKLGKLPQGTIIDWPDVPYRGTVEGFYGRPWGYEGRKSQIEFYGRNKMNTYIWAPKNDPYHHGFDSRKPYPPEAAKEIIDLLEVAKKNHVKFVWSIHPANTVDWKKDDGKPDMDLLVKKLELMYDMGVRHFALAVDDSGGEINEAKYQAKLTTYLTDHFIKKHPELAPFIMCPTGYHRRATSAEWLQELGSNLPPEVKVMWTGEAIIGDVTLEGQEWFTKSLGRPAFIWWNWPVTDGFIRYMAMGRAYSIDQSPKMKELYSGFVSNPMQWSEASKLGIFSVGNYTWNIEDFNSDKTWKDGIKRLYPSSAAAMQVFCNHNSALGFTHFKEQREESLDLMADAQQMMKDVQEGKMQSPSITQMKKKYQEIAASAKSIQSDEQLSTLREEISEWVTVLGLIGQAGKEAIDVFEGGEAQMDELVEMLATYGRLVDARESGIKPLVGTQFLTPATDALVQATAERCYTILRAGDTTKVATEPKPIFIASAGDAKKDTQALFDKRAYTFWEHSEQKAGQWYGLDLGRTTPIKNVELLMGGPRPDDYIAKGQMEYSLDGNNWMPLGAEQEGAHVRLELQSPKEARYVRYRVTAPRPNWIALCEFHVNSSSSTRQEAQSTVAEWKGKVQAARYQDHIGISRVLEPYTMLAQDSVSLSMKQAVKATGLQIDLGNDKIHEWAQVELTLEGGEKKILNCKQEGTMLVAGADMLPAQPIKALRLSNISPSAQEARLNSFKLFCPQENPQSYEENMTDGNLFTAWDAAALPSKNIPLPKGTKEVIILGSRLDALQIANHPHAKAEKGLIRITPKADENTLTLHVKDDSAAILIYEIILR